MGQMFITLHLKNFLLSNIYAIIPTLKSWAASIQWMTKWWFYCCIWKGKCAKIAHEIVVEALTTLICSFGLLWLATCQPCPTIVGFLDEPKCPTHGYTPNFKAYNCPTNTYNDFVSLFLTPIMTQLITYLAKEWMGSLHSLCSSYFMTTYSLALLIYGIAMPLGLLVLAILCGATYKPIMSMATRIIYGSSSMMSSMFF